MKQEYKQFWDVDLGVTYIPWEKVKLDDLDGFAEGGMIDQETVNNGEENIFAPELHLCSRYGELFHPDSALFALAEWEAQKNTEAPKEPQVQPVAAESSAASTSQNETFTQPVTMMPVQVREVLLDFRLLFLDRCSFTINNTEQIFHTTAFSLPKIPVAQTVPTVSLVPPAFPVTMAMPPPGFGPPPPFLRAGFNTTQPPPGTTDFMVLH